MSSSYESDVFIEKSQSNRPISEVPEKSLVIEIDTKMTDGNTLKSSRYISKIKSRNPFVDEFTSIVKEPFDGQI